MDLGFSLTELVGLEQPVQVLEIGAQKTGQDEPFDRLVAGGHAIVHAFEPDPEGAEKLKQHYPKPHKIHPFALGKGGKAIFHTTVSPYCGSLYPPNSLLLNQFSQLETAMQETGQQEIETHRLDDVLGDVDVDFIKIDVQGAELDVFEGGPKALSQASLIQTEVCMLPLYKGQPLMGDVDLYLREREYQFHTFWGIAKRSYLPMRINEAGNDGFRQMLWADAVYVRDFLKLKSLNADKLKRLAVLLHDLFQSCDLALLVLGELDKIENSQQAKAYWLKLNGQG